MLYLFNRQLKDNIEEIDQHIYNCSVKLNEVEDDDEHRIILEKLERLIELRDRLTQTKIKDSHTETIISGILGVTSIVLVLHYEKHDVITSRAFDMARNLFRRGV